MQNKLFLITLAIPLVEATLFSFYKQIAFTTFIAKFIFTSTCHMVATLNYLNIKHLVKVSTWFFSTQNLHLGHCLYLFPLTNLLKSLSKLSTSWLAWYFSQLSPSWFSTLQFKQYLIQVIIIYTSFYKANN